MAKSAGKRRQGGSGGEICASTPTEHCMLDRRLRWSRRRLCVCRQRRRITHISTVNARGRTMLGLLFRKRREDVRKVLYGRINRSFGLQVGKRDRQYTRSAFCEVVWLVPYDDQARLAEFDRVIPVVSKDICQEGLSLIHNEPIEAARVLVGLQSQFEPAFVLCQVEHSTALGYGFHQIGLFPEEVVHVEPGQIAEIRQRLQPEGADQAVTV
jgi:hypothetical protein